MVYAIVALARANRANGTPTVRDPRGHVIANVAHKIPLASQVRAGSRD